MHEYVLIPCGPFCVPFYTATIMTARPKKKNSNNAINRPSSHQISVISSFLLGHRRQPRHSKRVGSLNSGRSWGRSSSRWSRSVVSHMRPDQVTSSKCGTQRQFTSENTSSNYTGKLACVVSWVSWVRAANTEHVEHGGLWFKDSSSSESTNFDGRHGDRDLKGATETDDLLV